MTRAHPGTPSWEARSPRLGPKELADFYELNIHERETAKEAAKAIEAFRESPPMGTGNGYEGQTAGEIVSERMPDAHPRRRAAVEDVALAVAEEAGVDLSSRPNATDYVDAA